MSIKKDTLYASPIALVGSFKLDESVVNVFLNMIQRSVPEYHAIITVIGLLAGRYVQPHSNFEHYQQQTLQTELHYEFKKTQGYSDLEISQKHSALENVLLAETSAVHQQCLNTAGFRSVEVWFQYFNFASIITLK
ncbi:MAG: hypothetical protein L3J75_10100 [Methylococcaceae bacterium]|nr:hypothetical protein [Methylococcaceae bacterium]